MLRRLGQESVEDPAPVFVHLRDPIPDNRPEGRLTSWHPSDVRMRLEA